MTNKSNDDSKTDFQLIQTPSVVSQKNKDPFDSSVEKKKTEEIEGVGKKSDIPDIPFSRMFSFATRGDKFLLAIGTICALGQGAFFPMSAIFFGDAINDFSPLNMAGIESTALNYVGVACGMLVCSYVAFFCFEYTSQRQANAFRRAALKHILHKDISWYDKHGAAKLASRITGDMVKVQEGMGFKLMIVFVLFAFFVSGYLIAFINGWNLALMLFCVAPVIGAAISFIITKTEKQGKIAQEAYADAGAVAEERLSAMRTLASLNAGKNATQTYLDHVLIAEDFNIVVAKWVGLIFGAVSCLIWVSYGVGVLYGGWLISVENDIIDSPGKLFTVLQAIIFGTMGLAQLPPLIGPIALAKGAAAGLFHILDDPSLIDSSLEQDGIVPDVCAGDLELCDVEFSYPTRMEVKVLSNFNLRIRQGQMVALVGPSGGGKSSIISLLERFYDPIRGSIKLDGQDIKALQVKWLRKQIGLVAQEPVLFASSIEDNIRAGDNYSMSQVEAAAQKANIHETIMSLPLQYKTLVGENGVTLSGGQKQRIALARAIIRNPKIMLLDEATSALDNESERLVQESIDSIVSRSKMTTIVIAHRLSTIRNADKIVVVSNGKIMEQGTHEALMGLENGVYRSLITIQESEVQVKQGSTDYSSHLKLKTLSITSADTPDQFNEFMRTYSQRSISESERLQSKDVGEKIEEEKSKFDFGRLLRINLPEKNYLIAGLIAAVLAGLSTPLISLVIAEVIATSSEYYLRYLTSNKTSLIDLDKMLDELQLYGSLFFVSAAVLFFVSFVQNYCFKYAAEKLTTRLRHMNFSALCRQDIGFFDIAKNSSGALTADLSANSTKVVKICGQVQGAVIQGVVTIVAAMVISFIWGSWLLTLIMIGIFPFLIGSYVMNQKIMQKSFESGNDELAESGACATEAINNAQTVQSYGLESKIIEEYTFRLQGPLAYAKKQAHLNAFFSGFNFFMNFSCYAFLFWYGARLVQKGDITFNQLIRTISTIMMSIQTVSSSANLLSTLGESKDAASKIFTLHDRVPTIDISSTSGAKLEELVGDLEFRNITFAYPTRPDTKVLENFNLTIDANSTVALCGPSGGGKSTVIGLIERFYDPVKGSVLLDGNRYTDLNIKWLRDQIGMVGQEPILFDGTISENILYGFDLESMTDISKAELVEDACKMANAHGFIMNFPDGYKTKVGLKGTQLSGGQKQRIAIARAIVKNPRILILDEATSALDSESEKIVQAALDNLIAMRKVSRTTIIIAHRLSTIKNSDKICVISDGHVLESGTHNELMEMEGVYKNLAAKAEKQ